jgi:vacuolar-type H+-ATPase subunit I/STV1
MVRHPADFAGERKVGFVLSIAGYVVGTLTMLIFFRDSRLNMALMLSYLFTVVGLTVVNLMHYKASGHGSGAAGPATALTIVYGWLGAISFLLLVAVAVAKIDIKEHTLGQLCTGAGLSIASTLAAFAVMGMLRF